MNIFVIPEIIKNEVKDITFEMLVAARKVVQSSEGKVITILLGKNVKEIISQFGASDEVIIVDNENLEHYNPFQYQHNILSILKNKRGDLVFFPHTSLGMDIAGYVATKLNIPIIAFCKGIKFENGAVLTTSLICGGKILVDCKLKNNKGVVLVSSGICPAKEGKIAKMPKVEEIDYSTPESKIEFEKFIEPVAEDVDITKEEILVSVGRGIQNQENIAMAQELADSFGGVVTGSRPVIDQNWLPMTRQVGVSGKIVKPKLYLALGISGAPEHVEAMKESELIVAVNTDPKAPIFRISHYGINADIFEILPVLINKVKEERTIK